jgi:DNA-binding NtrC family response regulator
MANQFIVLVVDDEPDIVSGIGLILKRHGIESIGAENGEKALAMLREHPNVGMVLTDARMPGMDGYELVEHIRQAHPALPVAMMTAFATPELAVRAIRAGAEEYLSKPFDPEELVHLIKKIRDRRSLEEENRELRQKLSGSVSVASILGDSPQIERIRREIEMVAKSEATVLITGETGTGKELVARAIHGLSNRRENAFVGINSAAIPSPLLESELFGHARGAFTGANRAREGRLQQADRGTLFLDEIGDMPTDLQAKLLRVIEDMAFSPVGENRLVKVNVRIIAATHQDLGTRIESGEFRADLYHRLNVFRIEVPPLRQREGDVLLLARHFLASFTNSMGKRIEGFDEDAAEILSRYHWPGNIRELSNAIERAVILEQGPRVTPGSLPREIVESPGIDQFSTMEAAVREVSSISNGSLDERLAEIERKMIEQALDTSGGQFNQAAKSLGLSRHALRYRMQKLGMD